MNYGIVPSSEWARARLDGRKMRRNRKRNVCRAHRVCVFVFATFIVAHFYFFTIPLKCVLLRSAHGEKCALDCYFCYAAACSYTVIVVMPTISVLLQAALSGGFLSCSASANVDAFHSRPTHTQPLVAAVYCFARAHNKRVRRDKV